MTEYLEFYNLYYKAVRCIVWTGENGGEVKCGLTSVSVVGTAWNFAIKRHQYCIMRISYQAANSRKWESLCLLFANWLVAILFHSSLIFHKYKGIMIKRLAKENDLR